MNKNILMGALAALTIASASAETVYITGSTAFRSAANQTLLNLYGANLAATDKSSTSDASAGNLLFTNVDTGGGNIVDIAVAWSGSEAGIQTVACGTASKYLPFYDQTKVAAAAGSYPKTSLAGGNMSTLANSANTSLAKGTINFSDTFQGASVFTGTAQDGVTYSTLNDVAVGVVPFTFVANKDCPYTDITTSIFNDIASKGYTFGSLFTGATADTNVKCWLLGRNPDSGTRVTTLAVSKFGVQKTVAQVGLTASGGTITAIAKSTAGTINGISISAGNNGESSGGTLCGYMTNSVSGTVTISPLIGVTRGSSANYIIGYAGVSDAAGKFTGGLKYLTYNGVAPRCYNTNVTTVLDQGFTNIITGKYPFWSYEHVMWDPNYSTAGNSNVVTALTNAIVGYSSTNSTLAPNIALSDMRVKRSSDAGTVTPQ
jgi:hypothetical protein